MKLEAQDAKKFNTGEHWWETSNHNSESVVRNRKDEKNSLLFPKETSYNSWSPPEMSYLEKALCKNDHFPSISPAQQNSARSWLISLGIVVKEGEGGFVSLDDASTVNFRQTSKSATNNLRFTSTPIIPLAEDRLRNGIYLCDLFTILEKSASAHSHLAKIVHIKQPITVKKALENIQRALWLFRIKLCPPLPLKYLVHPREILIGNKDVLWGLLWEIYQCLAVTSLYSELSSDSGEVFNRETRLSSSFPKVESRIGMDPAVKLLSSAETLVLKNSRHPILPYTADQRRKLDQSLVYWIYSKENVIQPLMSGGKLHHFLASGVGSLSAFPVSILMLEGPIRDGTLLARITETVVCEYLARKVQSDPHNFESKHDLFKLVRSQSLLKCINQNPQTYKHCVQNVRKTIEMLRKFPEMSIAYLHGGVEDDIVRGDWNAILGLLEDIHRFDDNQAPRKPKFFIPAYPNGTDGGLHCNSSSTIPHEPYFGKDYDGFVKLQASSMEEADKASGVLFLNNEQENITSAEFQESCSQRSLADLVPRRYEDEPINEEFSFDDIGEVWADGSAVEKDHFGRHSTSPVLRRGDLVPDLNFLGTNGLRRKTKELPLHPNDMQMPVEDIFLSIPLAPQPVEEVQRVVHEGKYDDSMSLNSSGLNDTTRGNKSAAPVKVEAAVPVFKPSIACSRAPISHLILHKYHRDAVEILDWLVKIQCTNAPIKAALNAIKATQSDACDHDCHDTSKLSDDSCESEKENGKGIKGCSIESRARNHDDIATLTSAFDSLSSISDGTVLVKIAKVLTGSVNIPGTTLTPTKRAQRMQNVRKSLELIVNCTNSNGKIHIRKVPLSSILLAEEDIVNGDSRKILQVLQSIKAATYNV